MTEPENADSGSKWEGAGCFVICLGLALLIASGPIIAIIEAVKS